jgi:hypothetical protein
MSYLVDIIFCLLNLNFLILSIWYYRRLREVRRLRQALFFLCMDAQSLRAHPKAMFILMREFQRMVDADDL